MEKNEKNKGNPPETSMCDFVSEHAIAYVYGDLDEAAARRIDSHILRCEKCSGMIEGTRKTVRDLEVPDAEIKRELSKEAIREKRESYSARKQKPSKKKRSLLPMSMPIFVAGLFLIALMFMKGDLVRLFSGAPDTPTTITRPQGAAVRVDFEDLEKKNTKKGAAASDSEKVEQALRRITAKEDIELMKGSTVSAADRKMIGSIIQWNRHKLDRCYDIGKTEFPNLSGHLTVSFHIDEMGIPSNLAVSDRTIAMKRMELCVLDEITSWNFHRPANVQPGSTITSAYNFIFRKD